MQCFTYGNKHPRTMLWTKYQPPEPEAYRKRKQFVPEPKNGRPGCPDVKPFPKNILSVKWMQYNPPLEDPRRARMMPEMLDHINRVNWTTGQDVKILGRRQSLLSESLNYSLQPTTRAHYPGYRLGKPPLIRPGKVASVGITPCAYPAPCKPATENRYYLGMKDQELAKQAKAHHKDFCGLHTIPLELPAPFPGPAVPERPNVKVSPAKKTCDRMGIVP